MDKDPFSLEQINKLFEEFSKEIPLQDELVKYKQECDQRADEFKKSLENNYKECLTNLNHIESQIQELQEKVNLLNEANELKDNKRKELLNQIQILQNKKKIMIENKLEKLKDYPQVLNIKHDEDVFEIMKKKNLFNIRDDIQFYQKQLEIKENELKQQEQEVSQSEKQYIEIYLKAECLRKEIQENQSFITNAEKEFNQLNLIVEKMEELNRKIQYIKSEYDDEMKKSKKKEQQLLEKKQQNEDQILVKKASKIVLDIQLYHLYKQKETFEKSIEQLLYEEQQTNISSVRLTKKNEKLNQKFNNIPIQNQKRIQSVHSSLNKWSIIIFIMSLIYGYYIYW